MIRCFRLLMFTLDWEQRRTARLEAADLRMSRWGEESNQGFYVYYSEGWNTSLNIWLTVNLVSVSVITSQPYLLEHRSPPAAGTGITSLFTCFKCTDSSARMCKIKRVCAKWTPETTVAFPNLERPFVRSKVQMFWKLLWLWLWSSRSGSCDTQVLHFFKEIDTQLRQFASNREFVMEI